MTICPFCPFVHMDICINTSFITYYVYMDNMDNMDTVHFCRILAATDHTLVHRTLISV